MSTKVRVAPKDAWGRSLGLSVFAPHAQQRRKDVRAEIAAKVKASAPRVPREPPVCTALGEVPPHGVPKESGGAAALALRIPFGRLGLPVGDTCNDACGRGTNTARVCAVCVPLTAHEYMHGRSARGSVDRRACTDVQEQKGAPTPTGSTARMVGSRLFSDRS